MDPIIVLLFAMDLVSLMLAVILVTAWNSFGRPAHALSWCAAFAVAAVGWTLQILMVGGHATPPLELLARLLSMATWALLLVGFRQRARQSICRWRAAVIGGLSVATLVAATLVGDAGLIAAIPLLFAAAMLMLSAVTMMFRAGSPAERAVITMLLAFAMLEGIAALSALVPGAGAVQLPMFRTLILLTLPSAFTGTGLFAVFLLAADLADRMARLAACDPLTGIFNRRGFEEAAVRAIATARRQGQPITIVLADLDRFKSINDRYGHAVGDAVLRRFVQHVSGSIRRGDLLGRIGGEEFAMLLVGAEPTAAMEAIERIRVGLGRMEMETPHGRVRATASFGVTGPANPQESLSAMLSRADGALYQSKVEGRDRVSIALPPVPLGDEPAWQLAEAAL